MLKCCFAILEGIVAGSCLAFLIQILSESVEFLHNQWLFRICLICVHSCCVLTRCLASPELVCYVCVRLYDTQRLVGHPLIPRFLKCLGWRMNRDAWQLVPRNWKCIFSCKFGWLVLHVRHLTTMPPSNRERCLHHVLHSRPRRIRKRARRIVVDEQVVWLANIDPLKTRLGRHVCVRDATCRLLQTH